MNWFSLVTQDISRIPDAIAYYEQELDKASVEVKLHGNLEIVMSEVSNQVIKETEAEQPAVEQQDGDTDAD